MSLVLKFSDWIHVQSLVTAVLLFVRLTTLRLGLNSCGRVTWRKAMMENVASLTVPIPVIVGP
jgi:hypothetical protein